MLGLLLPGLRIRTEPEADGARCKTRTREGRTPATPASLAGRVTWPATAPGGLLSGPAQDVAALSDTALQQSLLRRLRTTMMMPSAEAPCALASDAAATRPTRKASATVTTGAGLAVAAVGTRRQRSGPGGTVAAASAMPMTRGLTGATCSNGAGRATGAATPPEMTGGVAATMSERGGGGGRAATLASGTRTRGVAGITTAAVDTRLKAAIRRRRCGDPGRGAGPERRRRSLHPRSRSSPPLRLPFRTRSPSSPCSALRRP